MAWTADWDMGTPVSASAGVPQHMAEEINRCWRWYDVPFPLSEPSQGVNREHP